METLSGECLCGAVSYECPEAPIMAVHCQCTDCQKLSGTGHQSSIIVPRGSVTLVGSLSFHEKKADSGNVIRRGFCPECGCHMYAENSGFPEFEFLRAGTLRNLESFEAGMVVFARSGASWDILDPALPKFDTMPAA